MKDEFLPSTPAFFSMSARFAISSSDLFPVQFSIQHSAFRVVFPFCSLFYSSSVNATIHTSPIPLSSNPTVVESCLGK